MRRRDGLTPLAAALATATVPGLAGGSAAMAQVAQVGADDVAVRGVARTGHLPEPGPLLHPARRGQGAGFVMLHGGPGAPTG